MQLTGSPDALDRVETLDVTAEGPLYAWTSPDWDGGPAEMQVELGATQPGVRRGEPCFQAEFGGRAEGRYIVAGVDHADASRRRTNREPPRFERPESWDERKFRDRAEDLRFLLDQLLTRSQRRGDALFGRVDRSRLGAVGHSLGGYTLLGIAGAWPAWRDERLRAFVLLSPYSAPYLGREQLAVSAPVMLQGGTFDVGITPSLPKLYALLPPPKYYAVLPFENHFGWTNLACHGRTTRACAASGNPREMVVLTRAFLDRHLRALPAKRLERKGALAIYQAELR